MHLNILAVRGYEPLHDLPLVRRQPRRRRRPRLPLLVEHHRCEVCGAWNPQIGRKDFSKQTGCTTLLRQLRLHDHGEKAVIAARRQMPNRHGNTRR